MTTKHIVHQQAARAQAPVTHTSPALVCNGCGNRLRFGDYEYGYLNSRLGSPCSCGGRYEFRSIADLYEADGVYHCSTLGRYYMTADCPKLNCWAKSCHLMEAMAEKVAEGLREQVMADVIAEVA